MIRLAPPGAGSADPVEQIGLLKPSANGNRHDSSPRVRFVEFSHELRDSVIAGDITVTFRLWRRPKVRIGNRYRVGPALIEIDSIELLPFGHISPADVQLSGERDRESLRQRAAHAGPISDHTPVYRIEFHLVGSAI
jgi:hypothetical protein